MALLPYWTKEIDLSQRALDPLGLSRISDFITNELLPGITTLTTKARNYSFYCWGIYQCSEEKVHTKHEFYQTMARLESSYVIASLFDIEENFPGARGPIGNDKGKRMINLAQNGMVEVNFSVLNHPGGGYGQYYKNAMNLLGLTINLQNREILTPKGEELALLFQKNIENTQYYREYISSDKIPLQVLVDYGKKANYLRLKDTIEEKETLSKVLFAKNQHISENPSSRRATLLLVLAIYENLSDKYLELTDDYYREILYFYRNEANGLLGPISQDIEKVIMEWKFFQFHEFFIISLEMKLYEFIEFLKDHESGTSLTQFLKGTSGFVHELELILKKNLTNTTLEEFLGFMLDETGIEGASFGCESSSLFDEKNDINNFYSEFNIYKKISESDRMNEIIGLSILLLCITLLRYRQYIDSFDEDIIWIKMKNLEEWSLDTFFLDINSRLSRIGLTEFFNITLEKIILRHDLIAMDKLTTGHDTFRFQRVGDLYFLKREYKYNRRNDRLNTIKDLFEDLGIIHFTNDLYGLTNFGKAIVKEND